MINALNYLPENISTVEDKKEMLEILTRLSDYQVVPLFPETASLHTKNLQLLKESMIGFDVSMCHALLNRLSEVLDMCLVKLFDIIELKIFTAGSTEGGSTFNFSKLKKFVEEE